MIHPIVAEDIDRIVEGISNQAQKLTGKTLLITGGAGFIGSYIVATIAALSRGRLPAPCHVISMDNAILRRQQESPHGDYRPEYYVCYA